MKTEKLIDTEKRETLKLDPDTYKFANPVITDLKNLKETQDMFPFLVGILFLINLLLSFMIHLALN